jgi:hypothetical protein
MNFGLRLGLALGLLLFLAPSAGAVELSTTLSSTSATQRSCTTSALSGAGVVRRTVTATATGFARGRLAAGGGDWDLGLFDETGRRVAGSASFGASELAEGLVAEGQQLTVQACRRPGAAQRASVSVEFLPVEVPKNPEPLQLVRVKLPTDASRDALDTLGLDVTEHARPGIQDVLLHSTADALALKRAGLDFDVLVADVVATDRRAKRAAAAAPGDGSAVPSGRTDYRRLPDYNEDMKKLARDNPGLVKPLTMPFKSLEGRSVEGVEITRDVNAKDGKPVFFMMGVHHAREWPSGEHTMEFAFELVKGMKAKDKRTMALLDRARVILVPIINPDGFNLSREAQPDVPVGPIGLLVESFGNTGFAYKRRNCRIQDFALPAAGQCGQQTNRTKGTDPNRNYGGFWGGAGASASPTNDTYRGSGPFSEPETQNVRAIVSQRQVTTLITNHTYSDLVLRPPGIRVQGDPPDEPVYKRLGDAMAKENGYSSEKSWELYDTTGTTEDWSYYATGGLGFTFEIGKAADGPTGFESLAGVGFHPPYPIGVTNEYFGKYPGGGGNREAYYKALESTADSKMHSVITGRAPAGAELRLKKQFLTKTSPVLQTSGAPKPAIEFEDVLETVAEVPASGRFELHTNPSTRPITVKGEPGRPAIGPPNPAFEFTGKGNTTSFPNELGAVGGAGFAPPGTFEDIPFTITDKQDNDKLTIVVAWADKADDYDTYLVRKNGQQTTQVASGAQGGGTTNSEQIVFRSEDGKPIPAGEYAVRVIDYSVATKGFRGSVTFEGPPAFVPPKPRSEAWTLSCELAGVEETRREVVIDRAEQVDVGTVCAGGATALGGSSADSRAAGGSVLLAGSVAGSGLRYAIAIDRRRLSRALRLGIRARARCSQRCQTVVGLRVDRKTARKLRLRSRTVARGTAGSQFEGRKTFQVRFTKEARRKLKGRRNLRVQIVGTVRDAGGRASTIRRPTALRR